MARAWTAKNLREELAGYEEELRAIKSLKRVTITQYCDHIETMISWLESRDRAQRSRARPPRRRRSYAAPSGVEVASVESLGHFEKTESGGVVTYADGWLADVHADQGAFEVQVGIRIADVYGRERTQAVAWVDGVRCATGSEPDSPVEVGVFASLIRPNRITLGPDERRPRGYDPSSIVLFADVIDDPSAYRHQAVLLHGRDHHAWAHHALVHTLARPRG